ncbi:T9SS type A sorting domain-containing protein [Aequorivita iocasae]|uniref:T9SS type A sorting domain-containing protein n=1 Tax=Aequorivita iocasae TaxID=2803865 RepID=A0ABX7DVK8_9FLAO|nr:T9SS type A sorting domain-containing protein [Aequorivita iocasae]
MTLKSIHYKKILIHIEGKLLSVQNVTLENQTSIDVSNLTSGIYFLNIEDENGNTTTKKFIKQ